MAAKNYSEILALVNAGNQMGLSNTIKRDYGIPLDFTSVQATYADAVIYAAENTKAYVGQPLSVGGKLYIINDVAGAEKFVVGEGEDAKEYDNYLVEVGSATEGDGHSIDLEGGVLKLHGFESALAGELPQKKPVFKKDAEGNDTEEVDYYELDWVAISAIVQGDGNKVTTLTSDDGSVVITKKTDTDSSLVYDLSVVHPDAPEYAIAKDERAEGATETTYHLTKDGENVDVAIVVPDAYDDTALAKEVSDEVTRAKEAEKALGERIDAIDFVDADELADAIKDFATTRYVDGEIDKIEEAIANLNHFTAKVVNSLEEVTEVGVLYLIKDNSVAGVDKYNEYIVVDNAPILIGDTTTDLSNYYNKTEIDAEIEALEGAIADEATARGQLAQNLTQAIATAKQEAIADADGKLADKLNTSVFTEFQTTNTQAISAARTGAVADVEAKGYAVATEVAETYLAKEQFNQYKTLAEGSFAKKSEVYTAEEVDELINNINEGNQETAGEVSNRLEAYKTSNDKEISNLKTKDGEHDTAIAAAQADATKALEDSGKNATALTQLSGLVSTNKNDISTISGRLDTAESQIGTHTTEIGSLSGKINALIAEDQEFSTTIGTLQGDLNNEASARSQEDARLAALITGNANNITAINNKIGTVPTDKTVIDLINAAKSEATYDDTAVKGLITAEENRAKGEEARIEALVAAEADRADKAEKANKALIDGIDATLKAALENDGEGLDSIKELAVWIEEHESEILPVIENHAEVIETLVKKVDTGDKTVSGYVANAIAAIPAATATALGLVKASQEVTVAADGTLGIGMVSTDKLVQGNMTLILDGGDAEISAN